MDPQHAWRLEELAKAADVSLGHAHNVVKRLEELSWVERDDQQRIQLTRAGGPAGRLGGGLLVPAERHPGLLLAGADHPRSWWPSWRRAAQEAHRRYAFTLHSGAALVAPNVRFPAIHCYLEGDPEPVARALGLRPGEGEGNVYLLSPYDQGVFYAPIAKGGAPGRLPAPALRGSRITTSAAGGSRPPICGARRWVTESRDGREVRPHMPKRKKAVKKGGKKKATKKGKRK